MKYDIKSSDDIYKYTPDEIYDCIQNLEILVECISHNITLNEEQQELLDNILLNEGE